MLQLAGLASAPRVAIRVTEQRHRHERLAD